MVIRLPTGEVLCNSCFYQILQFAALSCERVLNTCGKRGCQRRPPNEATNKPNLFYNCSAIYSCCVKIGENTGEWSLCATISKTTMWYVSPICDVRKTSTRGTFGGLRGESRHIIHEGLNRASRALNSCQGNISNLRSCPHQTPYFPTCFTPALSPSSVRSPSEEPQLIVQGFLRQISEHPRATGR